MTTTTTSYSQTQLSTVTAIATETILSKPTGRSIIIDNRKGLAIGLGVGLGLAIPLALATGILAFGVSLLVLAVVLSVKSQIQLPKPYEWTSWIHLQSTDHMYHQLRSKIRNGTGRVSICLRQYA
jgi:hypothetical protein